MLRKFKWRPLSGIGIPILVIVLAYVISVPPLAKHFPHHSWDYVYFDGTSLWSVTDYARATDQFRVLPRIGEHPTTESRSTLSGHRFPIGSVSLTSGVLHNLSSPQVNLVWDLQIGVFFPSFWCLAELDSPHHKIVRLHNGVMFQGDLLPILPNWWIIPDFLCVFALTRGVFYLGSHLIGLWRRRQSRCPDCGYTRDSTAICPECGKSDQAKA
ncbi:MAG: hypothetical protein GC200_07080 [Tepidisphaera sp.]|nr:hypothetical protein [Tepidisphaera sp.]